MDRVRRIEMLVAAAKAGSFAKAAEILQLDPSAVSRAIGKFERDLRVPLFYRTTRQLRLTDVGEELVQRGSEILRQLAELEGSASDTHGPLTGSLRVGMSVPIGREIVMPRIPQFLRQHPGLRIECLVLTQIKDMHANGVDILLRAGGPPAENVVARELGRIKLGVYGSPKYLETAREPRSPQDLLHHRCIVYKPHHMMRPWDFWDFERGGKAEQVKVPCTLVTDEREGLIAAAVAGCGLMRNGMFDPRLIRTGQLKRVLGDWKCPGGPPWCAFYRRTVRIPAKITAFLRFLTQALAEFDPEGLTMTHTASTLKVIEAMRALGPSRRA
ncbi:MAG: LysR family transcriptional regulator [Hyphomicrobiales bacterium]|nr:LysR family transcriptional regulator [Hyphomicrobiales bacterium]